MKTADFEARFFAKVERRVDSDCWVWTASKSRKNYGRLIVRTAPGRYVVHLAHRLSWFIHFGEMPELCVLHRCDNPPCVNPAHLFLGTRGDNTFDMLAKGRNRQVAGSRHYYSRLTEASVVEIRRLRRQGQSLKAIALQYCVATDTISGILRGRSWKHVPDDDFTEAAERLSSVAS